MRYDINFYAIKNIFHLLYNIFSSPSRFFFEFSV